MHHRERFLLSPKPPRKTAPASARRTATPAPATAGAADERPFWQRKKLSEMTAAEWESLCDGCGRCCLNKLEDEDTGRTFFTDVACQLLDWSTCRCKDYANRRNKVPDCVRLTWRNVRRIVWLPPTCAYDLLAKGRNLYWWHPLVSGDPQTVHAAGISVRGRVRASEETVPDAELEYCIVNWPGQVPRAGARAADPRRNKIAAAPAKTPARRS